MGAMDAVTFLDNKYRRWYVALMERAAARVRPAGYIEQHHVTPRALGGDHRSVVALTYREHFLAHWLLTKFTTGAARNSMRYALCQMCGMTLGRKNAGVSITSRQYALGRIAYAAARKERVVSDETRRRMSQALKGRTFTPEAREKLRAARLGKPLSETAKVKLSELNRGKSQSVEARRKNSIAHLGKRKSAETRERISAAKRGANHPLYGKPVSAETIAKRRATLAAKKQRAEAAA